MLRRLSGRAHDVFTGVTLRHADGEETFVERTLVWFAPMSEDDIAWYVASGEPTGKAGAYGIQGKASRFVTRVDGSYPNVVGLPTAQVAARLSRYGRGA
jgi:septum formation protein